MLAIEVKGKQHWEFKNPQDNQWQTVHLWLWQQQISSSKLKFEYSFGCRRKWDGEFNKPKAVEQEICTYLIQ